MVGRPCVKRQYHASTRLTPHLQSRFRVSLLLRPRDHTPRPPVMRRVVPCTLPDARPLVKSLHHASPSSILTPEAKNGGVAPSPACQRTEYVLHVTAALTPCVQGVVHVLRRVYTSRCVAVDNKTRVHS